MASRGSGWHGAGFIRTLRSRKIFSFFRLSGAATHQIPSASPRPEGHGMFERISRDPGGFCATASWPSLERTLVDPGWIGPHKRNATITVQRKVIVRISWRTYRTSVQRAYLYYFRGYPLLQRICTVNTDSVTRHPCHAIMSMHRLKCGPRAAPTPLLAPNFGLTSGYGDASCM